MHLKSSSHQNQSESMLVMSSLAFYLFSFTQVLIMDCNIINNNNNTDTTTNDSNDISTATNNATNNDLLVAKAAGIMRKHRQTRWRRQRRQRRQRRNAHGFLHTSLASTTTRHDVVNEDFINFSKNKQTQLQHHPKMSPDNAVVMSAFWSLW
jgi:hypothetical protein